jgi:hypothetical protein
VQHFVDFFTNSSGHPVRRLSKGDVSRLRSITKRKRKRESERDRESKPTSRYGMQKRDNVRFERSLEGDREREGEGEREKREREGRERERERERWEGRE